MKALAAAILVALAAPAARADVFIVKKTSTGAVKTPAGEQPAREDTQTTWFAADRVRMERPRATYLIRFDQQKLYVLFPDKTYSALDLPIDLKRHVKPEDMAEFEELAAKLNTTTNVTSLDEKGKFRDWSTSKFALKSTSPTRASDDVVWTTKDVQLDWDAYWKAQNVVLALTPYGERSATELRKLDGITVKADRKVTVGDVTFEVHEELVTLERKQAPEGTYDLPADYTAKTYEVVQNLRRDAGAGKGRGDAKPDDDGGKRKRGEAGKGGDDQGGGDKGGKRRGGGGG